MVIKRARIQCVLINHIDETARGKCKALFTYMQGIVHSYLYSLLICKQWSYMQGTSKSKALFTYTRHLRSICTHLQPYFLRR